VLFALGVSTGVAAAVAVLSRVRGYFRSLSPRLGQSDRDRLLPTRDLPPATSALQCAAFPFAHRTFHRFLRGLSIPWHRCLPSV